MAFLVATTSLPAVYRPNGYAWASTAGTPHALAKILQGQVRTRCKGVVAFQIIFLSNILGYLEVVLRKAFGFWI